MHLKFFFFHQKLVKTPKTHFDDQTVRKKSLTGIYRIKKISVKIP